MQPFFRSSRLFAVTLSSEALITSLSSEAEALLGYSPQELLHKPITQILSDDSAFEVPQIMNTAGKWGVWEGGMTLQSRAGNPIETRGALALLAGSENQSSGYLLISDLDQSPAAKTGGGLPLGAISARLRAVAHDLNNPLAVMMGFTQLLSVRAACSAEIRADLEKVHSELKRVIEIVEELHDYAVSLGEKPARSEPSHGTSRPDFPAGSGGLPSTPEPIAK